MLPAVAFLTLLTNGLACGVLVRRRMRNASNAILAALSVSNTLTALAPAPVYLHFYALGHHTEFLSIRWCTPYTLLASYLPSSFHVVSVWLTLLLAVQRYLHVCRSGSGGRRTNSWARPPMSRIGLMIAALFLLGPIFNVLQLVMHTCEPVTVPSRTAGVSFDGRRLEYTNMTSYVTGLRLLGEHYKQVTLLQHWAHVLFVNFLPSLLLIIFNALLIIEIRRSIARRARLRSGSSCTQSSSHSNSNGAIAKPKRRVRRGDSQSTTLMLVTVLCISLVLEVPLGLTRIVQTLSFTFGWGLSERRFKKLALLLNALIVVSYSANLLIYCAMSRLFRRAFLRQLRAFSCCLSRIPFCDPNRSPHSTELLSFELASRQNPIAHNTTSGNCGHLNNASIRRANGRAAAAAEQLDILPEKNVANLDFPATVVAPIALVSRVRFPIDHQQSSPESESTPSPPHPTRTPVPSREPTNSNGAITAIRMRSASADSYGVKIRAAVDVSEPEKTTASTTTTATTTSASTICLSVRPKAFRPGVQLNVLGGLRSINDLENSLGIELATPSPSVSDRSRGSFRIAF